MKPCRVLFRNTIFLDSRYTSYPTVPYWSEDSINSEQWKASLRKSFEESNEKEGISLYIHLPFCESLCTFCGCQTYHKEA